MQIKTKSIINTKYKIIKSYHPPSRSLSQDDMEKRRILASKYFETKDNVWIGNKYGVSKTAVFYWKLKWNKDKKKGLHSGKYGRTSKLSDKQEKQFKKDILKGAEKCGYDTDFWTLNRLTKYVKKTFKVKYEDRSLFHTMERLGFSCQKPMRRARERNESAISNWVKNLWPKIKKKPTN